jgi:hypothetical protein
MGSLFITQICFVLREKSWRKKGSLFITLIAFVLRERNWRKNGPRAERRDLVFVNVYINN